MVKADPPTEEEENAFEAECRDEKYDNSVRKLRQIFETEISEADTYQAIANAALGVFNKAHIDVDFIDPSITGEPDGIIETTITVNVPQI